MIDRRELYEPAPSVTRVLRHAALDGPPLDPDGVRAFTDVLLPRFQFIPSLKALSRPARPLGERIAEEQRKLIRFTEEQMRVLEYNGHLPRLAVEGGAGTGKTLVALEQTRRLAADRPAGVPPLLQPAAPVGARAGNGRAVSADERFSVLADA